MAILLRVLFLVSISKSKQGRQLFKLDYLFIAIGSYDDVIDFFNGLNNISITASSFLPKFNLGEDIVALNDIQFTLDIDRVNPSHIKVLDIDIVYDAESKKILTQVFSKPTDTHCYLSPSSCHPKSTFIGIISQVALRLRSITE